VFYRSQHYRLQESVGPTFCNIVQAKNTCRGLC
jgi:hypothetical protein